MFPHALQAAILREIEGVSRRDLQAASDSLSNQYREAAGAGAAPLATDAARLAYLVTRLPATYAATEAALAELRARCPELEPRTLLDLGAGPGSAAWATRAVFGSVSTAVLVERDPGFVALGRRLAAELPIGAAWRHADAVALSPGPRFDLVVLAYVAGELPPGRVDQLIERAWAAAEGALVIVEPGTPAGYSVILRARSRLLGLGATIVAPCPHEAPCPLTGADWCHFGVRLARSREHRLLKGGALGFEDEKFSYLAATCRLGAPAPARVLRRPDLHKGHVRLRVCGAAGLATLTIGRSEGEAYHAARHARWGDAWTVGT